MEPFSFVKAWESEGAGSLPPAAVSSPEKADAWSHRTRVAMPPTPSPAGDEVQGS